MSIAVLPMYDFPELRSATDAFWNALASRLRGRGIDAPDRLTRTMPLDRAWADPCLLLGQTCGYPLVTTLRGEVTLLATPRYNAAGCEGSFYRSAIVLREDDDASNLADLRGRRCAVNDMGSNSGMNLLRAEIAKLATNTRFFGEVVVTGSHAASVLAVAGGQADVAAIDCVTWAHLQHLRPQHTRRLRRLAWTTATPGLPLVTSVRTGGAERAAIVESLHDVATDSALEQVRATLLLDGFETLDVQAYEVLLDLESRARTTGYPALL